MKQSFSTSEVANYCHVTADTIRKWAEAGRIRVFKTPGGHRRIRREDLLRFLRENDIPVHPELSEARERILIVDHEMADVTLIRRFLERIPKPSHVEVATDAYDTGRFVAVFQPDVILLNLSLPNADGLAMCRKIRQAPESSGVTLIGLLPSGSNDLEGRSLDAGISYCIQKPFTPDDLRRTFALAGIEVN
jgi:excisionase family DNA binding protein